MVKISPEFLSKNGRREFAVLTMKDFGRLMEAVEDAEDLRILRAARRRNAGLATYTHKEVKQRLGRKRKIVGGRQ